MIDVHLAAMVWWAAVAGVFACFVFVGGMAFGVRREQDRQEWVARRRAREMRR